MVTFCRVAPAGKVKACSPPRDERKFAPPRDRHAAPHRTAADGEARRHAAANGSPAPTEIAWSIELDGQLSLSSPKRFLAVLAVTLSPFFVDEVRP